jgi:hypothetical protein
MTPLTSSGRSAQSGWVCKKRKAKMKGISLKSFAQEHLFSPRGAEVGEWLQYEDGYTSVLAAT